MIKQKTTKIAWMAALLLLLTISILTISGCSKDEITEFNTKYPVDGPYIFPHPQGYDVFSVNSERRLVHKIISEDYFTVKSALYNELTFQINIRENLVVEPDEYTTDKKVLVVSDIEGDLPLLLEFLGSNGVINDQLEWVYGENHLVIIGDFFDRGVDVTALLWYVYKLEGEAEKQGGKVHSLLGNHEALVMSGDLTWSDPKYLELTTVLGTPMEKIFRNESILGGWLRTKNTIEKINGILYCHAGISYEFIERNHTIDEANQTIRENLDVLESEICLNEDDDACFFFYKNGPLWYNGYFHPDGIDVGQIDEILSYLQVELIVVGHSKVSEVEILFDAGIIAIDTHTDDRNDEGQYSESWCEGILIEDGKFYRVNNLGDKSELIP